MHRINIEPNATVVEDLEIMVIEAMKMETPI
ncbi:MAG: acetyl-CoA carboxylase biotin carboxyl carrier protein subunit, partial [Deltaproteobacteria bacterium]|nr:acetyl-CoA carboxylase biotin carboxyl carrier protein subunit [Deltaproteobacteria bacterium]